MNLHVENAMVIRLGYGQPLPVDGRNIVVVWMSQATNLARWGHLRRSREGIDVTLVAVVHSSNRFWRDRKSRQNHTPQQTLIEGDDTVAQSLTFSCCGSRGLTMAPLELHSTTVLTMPQLPPHRVPMIARPRNERY
jgi:hypothetical protein